MNAELAEKEEQERATLLRRLEATKDQMRQECERQEREEMDHLRRQLRDRIDKIKLDMKSIEEDTLKMLSDHQAKKEAIQSSKTRQLETKLQELHQMEAELDQRKKQQQQQLRQLDDEMRQQLEHRHQVRQQVDQDIHQAQTRHRQHLQSLHQPSTSGEAMVEGRRALVEEHQKQLASTERLLANEIASHHPPRADSPPSGLKNGLMPVTSTPEHNSMGDSRFGQISPIRPMVNTSQYPAC